MLRRVTYRDDRDADRARIESLEAELAAANRRVSELEHKESTALVKATDGAVALMSKPGPATTWFGSPLTLELMRDFDGAFPTENFEDLIEPIRTLLRDSGRTEVLKSSLTWSATAREKSTGPFLVATVSVRDGRTKLTVTDKLGPLAGAMFGGVGGGVGGGTIVVPIIAGGALFPPLIPVFLLGWLGASWFGSRAIFKRVARRRANQMQRVFEALVEEIQRGIEKARKP
jgi:hypothetical protein